LEHVINKKYEKVHIFQVSISPKANLFLFYNSSAKKMVYLSASGHPPFIPRYITTKEEAENHIFSKKNLKGAALKPGFIYSL